MLKYFYSCLLIIITCFCIQNTNAQGSLTSSLNGSFEVNNNGAASYSINIDLPPGVGNSLPQLSISYNSQGGNGTLGQGISLGGIPGINRCGATYQQDGFKGGVSYDTNDRFELGSSRFMKMNNVGSTYSSDGSVYHTELESWSQITATGTCGSGPCNFTALNKQGYTYIFGGTPDSQVLAVGPDFKSGSQQGSIRQWFLSKQTDLNGNGVNYLYTQNPKTPGGSNMTNTANRGVVYPDKILFTYNTQAQLQARRMVQFYYESRADTAVAYMGGGMIQTMARMAAIGVFGIDEHNDTTLIRKYILNYDPNAPLNISRILSISLVGSNGVIYATDSFQWTNQPNQLNNSSFAFSGSYASTGWQADFNADGRTDLLVNQSNKIDSLYLAQDGGFKSYKLDTAINLSSFKFIADFNGDGRTDIFTGSSSSANLFLATGEDFIRQPIATDSIRWPNANCSNCFWSADFNGDGKSDLLSVSGTQAFISFSKGTGFSPYQSFQFPSLSLGENLISDFNGDGLADILAAGADSIYLSNWSAGSGFQKGIATNVRLLKNTVNLFSDFNGDNLADLVVQNGQLFYVYFSNGAGLNAGIPVNFQGVLPNQTWLGDYNGDGLMDILAQNANTYSIYYSTGASFINSPTSNLGLTGQNFWLGDFNGDGITDIFIANNHSLSQNYNSSQTNQNQLPNLISQINNNLGGKINLRYQPISNNSIYQKTENSDLADKKMIGGGIFNTYNPVSLSPVQRSNYPVQLTQNGMYVVSAYSESDGLGHSYNYGYQYEGAKVDIMGIGWLGFKRISKADTTSQNITHSSYLQKFPFTGRAESTLLTDLKGNVLRTSRNYYKDSVSYGNNGVKIYHVTVSKSRSSFFDNNTYQFTTGYNYAYDSFGNTTLTVDLGDTIQTSNIVYTINTYSNNTTNWRIGYTLSSTKSANSTGTSVLSGTQYTYDPTTYNQTKVSSWLNTSNTWLNQYYGYDICGNQIWAVGLSNDTTRTIFDSVYYAFPIKRISPPNQWGKKLVVQTQYNPSFGTISGAIDANGNKFQQQVDAIGRDSLILGPDSKGVMTILAKINYLPYSVGFIQQNVSLNSWTNPSWETSEEYFDGMLRNYLTNSYSQNNQIISQQSFFNSQNKVIQKSLPYFSNTNPLYSFIQYDPNGRVVKITRPNSATNTITTTISYRGKQVTVHKAVNSADSTSGIYYFDYFNSSKKIVRHVNPANDTTRFAYDLLANQLGALDPAGLKTSYTYNSLGGVTTISDPSSGTLTKLYNYQANTVSIVKNSKDTIVNTYDNIGRLILVTANRKTLYQYQYDVAGTMNGMGNLCKVMAPTGKINYLYEYNPYTLPAKTTLQIGNKTYTEAFVYNPNKSNSAIVYPDSSVATYQYYTNGLLQQIAMADHNHGNTKAMPYITYQNYDASGNELALLYGNNVSRNAVFMPFGNLDSLSMNDATGKNILNLGFDWNDLSQIVAINDYVKPKLSQTFTYWANDRLHTAKGGYGNNTFQYDAAGNLTQRDSMTLAYTNYQVKNAYQKGKQVLANAYDVNGNMNQRTTTAKGKSSIRQYDYNVLNQLMDIRNGKDTLFSFVYNYNGQRILKYDHKKKESTLYVSPRYEITTTADSIFKTKYVNDPSKIIAAVTQAYGRKNTASKTNRTVYYHQNNLNTTLLTTTSGGAEGTQIYYTPFGEQYAINGKKNVRYTFGSKELDGSGLYYFSARYYDPFTSRFITADDQLGGSKTQTDAYNRYAYTLNNPIKYYDPTGHNVLSDAAIGLVLGIEVVVDVASDGTLTAEEMAIDEVGEDFLAGLRESKKAGHLTDNEIKSSYKVKRAAMSDAPESRYAVKPSGGYTSEMYQQPPPRVVGSDVYGNDVFNNIGSGKENGDRSLAEERNNARNIIKRHPIRYSDNGYHDIGRDIEKGEKLDFTVKFDNYNLIIGHDKIKHSVLANGDNIYTAGTVQWDGGNNKLIITNKSGHYEPTGHSLKMSDPFWRVILDYLPDGATIDYQPYQF